MILINNKLYDFIFDILPKLTGCFDKPLRQRRTGKTVKEDFFVSVTHDLSRGLIRNKLADPL